jgi:thiamine-monophosphate kinase
MTERGRDEFDVIARLFAPLATDPAARALADDAALLGDLVITTDAIVEGVHFLANDPIETVARKALRVNLSDLAAKGAAPLYYLLTLAWPAGRRAGQLDGFAAGLAHDQRTFALSLLGGDTTSTDGPLVVAVTMLGKAGLATPARAGAAPGDELWVSGSIGDGGLGLAALRGEIFAPEDFDYLVGRYRLPEPRVALAPLIAAEAHAAMDLSDGLAADARKLAAASGVAAEIDAERMPLSDAAARWLAQREPAKGLAALAGFGDDYEILFAASPARAGAIAEAARQAGAPVVRIGKIKAGHGVEVLHAGAPLALGPGGYAHRIGR